MANAKYLYLMIKTHQVTGLKYLCKKVTTSDSKAISYKGSGTRWNNHLKVHGNHINTEILAKYDLDKINEFSQLCLEYSNKFDIVKSNEWANLIEENGLMGAVIGENNPMKNPKILKKMIMSINDVVYKKKACIRASDINSRPEVKEKIRQSKLGNKNPSKRKEVKEKIKKSINCPHIIDYLKKINTGIKNPMADLTEYAFKHKTTGIVLSGTKYKIEDETKKLNQTNKLILILTLKNMNEFFRKNRKINSVKGWIKL